MDLDVLASEKKLEISFLTKISALSRVVGVALPLDRWSSDTSLACQSGLAEENCPDDGVSQAVSLRVEQGLMGNSGVVITQSPLRSASRQSHLKSTSFTAVKVRMFV